MLEQGLIEETAERPDPEFDDERRRDYRITVLGTAVPKAEARRPAQLVKLAGECGCAPGRAHALRGLLSLRPVRILRMFGCSRRACDDTVDPIRVVRSE
jgi:hypothetical protein